MIFEEKSNTLYIDGCSSTELAEQYGTPLYVFSETEIVARIGEIREQFLKRYPNTRAAYAGKAFCVLAMCKILEREGMALDVVSGGEIYTAMKAQFPAERIEFNGNNKERWEIELAVDYGVGRIIIDGMRELELIESVCKEKGKKIPVLYRITPGVHGDTHEYIVTGKKDSKFGIPLDEEVIYPAIERAIASQWVTFKGLHFHVGSQLFDNSSHLQALEVMLELYAQTHKRFGFAMTELNIGGGFGARYVDGDERQDFTYFLDPMMQRIEQVCSQLGTVRPTIVIEPGRSIVAEAGITLYTVGEIKEIPDVRTYVSINGGMTDNIRPALYQATYTGVVANRVSEPKTQTITLCGKCCESSDVLIKDLAVAPLQSGDLFAVFSTGAYGYSMSSNYNKLQTPPVVLVKEGKHGLIVRGQTLDQLIENELLPEGF